MSNVIEIRDLVKRYGGPGPRRRRRGADGAGAVEDPGGATSAAATAGPRDKALDGLELSVRRGEVFGFLGPNGAGKTTTIRLMLDTIRPTSGQVRVLGQDPTSGGPALRRRLGYLPGDVRVETRQSARALIAHFAALRGGVPSRRYEALAERLQLDLDAPIRSLSKGNRQKVGLVQAFMHDSELHILDEPTSGLDPLFQREFLSMVREAVAAGSTVFMSSHVLSEVQQVADRAGIIREGRMVALDDVETLRRRALRRVEVVFADDVPADAFARVDGLEQVEVHGRVLRARLAGSADAWVKAIARFGVVDVTATEPDLEELFFAHYAREGDRRAA